MEAGIHRLRTTVHLIRMIDDTLAYIPPRCKVSLPCSHGRSLLSSQLFKFLRSKQYLEFRHKPVNIGHDANDVAKTKVQISLSP